MVTANTGSVNVTVLLGNGDGTFGPKTDTTVGSGPHGLALLDVDGDGDLDIATANTGLNRLAILRNNGAGQFGSLSTFEGGGGGEYALAAGDYNEDGMTDLIVGAYFDSTAIIHLSNGDGTFAMQPPVNAGGSPWMMQAGDVNNDGHLDISCANGAAGNSSILLGNGAGGLGAPQTLGNGSGAVATDLGDLDGDGDLDWVVSYFGSSEFIVYRNTGSGTFVFDQSFPADSNGSCAALYDIDHDRDLDMLLFDEIADTIRVMRNLDAQFQQAVRREPPASSPALAGIRPRVRPEDARTAPRREGRSSQEREQRLPRGGYRGVHELGREAHGAVGRPTRERDRAERPRFRPRSAMRRRKLEEAVREDRDRGEHHGTPGDGPEGLGPEHLSRESDPRRPASMGDGLLPGPDGPRGLPGGEHVQRHGDGRRELGAVIGSEQSSRSRIARFLDLGILRRFRGWSAKRFLTRLHHITHRLPLELLAVSPSRILVIAPHMDDAEISCGGTMILHGRAGSELGVVYTTDSGNAEGATIPGEELKRCAGPRRRKRRGRRAWRTSASPGSRTGTSRTTRKSSRRCSRSGSGAGARSKLLPFPADNHRDHQSTSAAVALALEISGWRGKVWCYECGRRSGRTSRSTSRRSGEKARAIACYGSQTNGMNACGGGARAQPVPGPARWRRSGRGLPRVSEEEYRILCRSLFQV